jgi:hypothetical protein
MPDWYPNSRCGRVAAADKPAIPGSGTRSYDTGFAGRHHRPRSAGRRRFFRWIDARLTPLPAQLPGLGVIALSSRILLHR